MKEYALTTKQVEILKTAQAELKQLVDQYNVLVTLVQAKNTAYEQVLTVIYEVAGLDRAKSTLDLANAKIIEDAKSD